MDILWVGCLCHCSLPICVCWPTPRTNVNVASSTRTHCLGATLPLPRAAHTTRARALAHRAGGYSAQAATCLPGLLLACLAWQACLLGVPGYLLAKHATYLHAVPSTLRFPDHTPCNCTHGTPAPCHTCLPFCLTPQLRACRVSTHTVFSTLADTFRTLCLLLSMTPCHSTCITAEGLDFLPIHLFSISFSAI